MKTTKLLRTLFSALTAIALMAFVGCNDTDEPSGTPSLKVSPTALSFKLDGTAASGSTVKVDCNRTWKVERENPADTWMSFEATGSAKGDYISGNGSVKVTAAMSESAHQARLKITMYNGSTVLKTEYVTVSQGDSGPVDEVLIYKEQLDPVKIEKDYPYIDQYTKWVTTGEGASSVTYSGSGASVRGSGLANTGKYDGASGPNVFFFGANAYLVVNKITLTDTQKNLKLTFGGNYGKQNDDKTYDNVWKKESFHVYLSADGEKWTELSYTNTEAVTENAYWVVATSDFTLKDAATNLYIKFAADLASVFRIDDIKLTTGVGGTVIDLAAGQGGGGETGETTPITIPELVEGLTTTNTVIDATNDRELTAVVMNDVASQTYAFNNLILATEGATTAGNGITVYGVEPSTLTPALAMGDKVKLTLKAGKAKKTVYNGMYEILGDKGATDWYTIEKIGTASTTPVVITADKLASFQGMLVTIKDATTAAAGIWATADTDTSHTLSAGGASFTVFCKKGEASPLCDMPFAAATADITGLAAVYKNAAQIVPRNAADVAGFASTAPTITGVNPDKIVLEASGAAQTIAVDAVNNSGKAITVKGLTAPYSATVSGTTVTVSATANTATTAVAAQTLTISIEGGNSVTVPVSQKGVDTGNNKTVEMTAAQIISGKTGLVALVNSGYGSQAVATPSTWYTWAINGIEFQGVRLQIGKSPESIVGQIQIQGNDSTVESQGIIENVTALPGIKKIVLTLGNSSTDTYVYTPAYSLYGGSTKIDVDSSTKTAEGYFVQTFDLSGGNYSTFKIHNNIKGALYIVSIEVEYAGGTLRFGRR